MSWDTDRPHYTPKLNNHYLYGMMNNPHLLLPLLKNRPRLIHTWRTKHMPRPLHFNPFQKSRLRPVPKRFRQKDPPHPGWHVCRNHPSHLADIVFTEDVGKETGVLEGCMSFGAALVLVAGEEVFNISGSFSGQGVEEVCERECVVDRCRCA